MDTNTIESNINGAQSQSTFDVLAFVEATAYPAIDVVVFQDVKSAAEYVRLVKERLDDDANKDVKTENPERDAEIARLGDAIKSSSLIFTLRGMPPGIVDDILKEPEEDTPELAKQREDELVAKTIQGVRNNEGAKDSRVWDTADISKLRRHLEGGEFGKLLKGVSEVNFTAMVFDQATDAGFSGRSSDVA